MGLFDKLRRGTEVYGPDGRPIGKVDRWDDNYVYINDREVPRSSFDRFDKDHLYFSDAGYRTFNTAATGTATGGATDARAFTNADQGEIRVPVMEERIDVEKRPTQLGEVAIHKEVTSEQVNVPVELRRDEVNVERVNVENRPIAADEVPHAFEEGTIRVPVRGEEAVANKQAVVTGEVVIDRDTKTERQTISDTVRKEQVKVDENYDKMREGFRQHFDRSRAGLTGTAVDTRTFDEAEPNYRYGYMAGRDERYAGRDFAAAEPELRREHATTGGDTWEHLRDEIREGWDRARDNF